MIELIPVIELDYGFPDIAPPEQGPYWKFPEVWSEYRRRVYEKAGFEDPLLPYSPGSPFHRVTGLSQKNLALIVTNFIEACRRTNGSTEAQDPFFGGYVLRTGGKDRFFPQSGGDLSDIDYWRDMAAGNEHPQCMGHPDPLIRMEGEIVHLEFNDWEGAFQPPPSLFRLELNKSELSEAVSEATKELKIFAGRLREIKINRNLPVQEIDRILIRGA